MHIMHLNLRGAGMSIAKYYADKSAKGELPPKVEAMSEAGLELFQQENGEQQTIGYLKAMADFQKQMYQILRYPDGRFPHTDRYVHSNLKLFYVEQKSFLDTQKVIDAPKVTTSKQEKLEP